MMILKTPTKLVLPTDDEKVRRFLTFRDRSADYMLSKLRRNFRWAKGDPEGHLARMEELKSQAQKCILYKDENGTPFTYAGLKEELHQRFKWDFKNEVKYPDIESLRQIPWNKVPFDMHYYQKKAVDLLIEAKHAAVELPTGSGKSLVLLNLAKRLPVKTLIVTPSAAITDQLYENFVEAFGQKFCGKYGDGAKRFDRLYTIATAQSITRIEEGSPAWVSLRECQSLMFDESHTTPAETFEAVCLGIAENAPFRFFVSATQLRGDGSEMVLKGITGPIVYKKDFLELVDEGYLAKPIIKMFKVPTYGAFGNPDVKTETRNQLYLNPNVNRLAADIANKAVLKGGRQTIIRIEEMRQFVALQPFLTVEHEFIHGGITKEQKEYVPERYWNIDREKIIENFNSGKTKLLIGTKAISTGVDLKPTECIIYLQGGQSEIALRQGIGRGTRMCTIPGTERKKKDCWVVDFIVVGSKTTERHAYARKDILSTIGSVDVYG